MHKQSNRKFQARRDEHKAVSWRTHIVLNDPSVPWDGELDREYVGEDAAHMFVDHMAELSAKYEKFLHNEFPIHGPAPKLGECYLCKADLTKAPETPEEYRTLYKKDDETLREYVQRHRWPIDASAWNEGHSYETQRREQLLQTMIRECERKACYGCRPVRDHCHLDCGGWPRANQGRRCLFVIAGAHVDRTELSERQTAATARQAS